MEEEVEDVEDVSEEAPLLPPPFPPPFPPPLPPLPLLLPPLLWWNVDSRLEGLMNDCAIEARSLGLSTVFCRTCDSTLSLLPPTSSPPPPPPEAPPSLPEAPPPAAAVEADATTEDEDAPRKQQQVQGCEYITLLSTYKLCLTVNPGGGGPSYHASSSGASDHVLFRLWPTTTGGKQARGKQARGKKARGRGRNIACNTACAAV